MDGLQFFECAALAVLVLWTSSKASYRYAASKYESGHCRRKMYHAFSTFHRMNVTGVLKQNVALTGMRAHVEASAGSFLLQQCHRVRLCDTDDVCLG